MSRKKQQNGAGAGGGPLEGVVTGLLRAAFRRRGASTEFRERLISTSLNILAEPRNAGAAARFEETAGGHRANSLPGGIGDLFNIGAAPADRRNVLGAQESADDSSEAEQGQSASRLRGRTQSDRRGF
ncbi:MAG: hypothetical protein LC772_00315 [Chloroflexi bacterium]|nr:hypothetical protein [Chloroflexota bacterium]